MKAWLKGGLIGIGFSFVYHLVIILSIIIPSSSLDTEMPGLVVFYAINTIPFYFIFSLLPFFFIGAMLGIIINKIQRGIINFSNWLKGGVIGLFFGFIFSVWFLIIMILYLFPSTFLHKEKYFLILFIYSYLLRVIGRFSPFLSIPLLLVLGFLIGALVGFVVGKIKGRNKNENVA